MVTIRCFVEDRSRIEVHGVRPAALGAIAVGIGEVGPDPAVSRIGNRGHTPRWYPPNGACILFFDMLNIVLR